MTTKIQKQIEERIDEKICVSEMNVDINRFIKVNKHEVNKHESIN